MNSFIFDSIRDTNTAILGDYYYFVNDNGLITFKTKMPNELLHYRYIKFVIGKKIYITDIYGNFVLISKEDKLENDLKQLFSYKNEVKASIATEGNNYILYENSKDTKTGLYGIKDNRQNTIIPNKYKNPLCELGVYDENKVYFYAKDNETNKCGVIDINENIIIPFMYDEIHWFILGKLIPVSYNGKYGVIDINNNVLVPFKYQWIMGFLDYDDPNICCFAENFDNKWGIINRQGKEIEIDLENVKELDESTFLDYKKERK